MNLELQKIGDPRTIEITEYNPQLKCVFCGRGDINPVEFGSMFQLKDVITHHFCLLFSALAQQNGKDNEGIQAFLLPDIKKELKRGTRLKCRYCRKNYATIGCCQKNCTLSYHYTCGYEHGCVFQFKGQYNSYCPKHCPKQNIPEGISIECSICFTETNYNDGIWPPCCKKQLFHRSCLMKSAIVAGYFFRCPLCNDGKQFCEAMKLNGVYIPDQDAAWENDRFHEFSQQLELYSHCDAESCICPDGRSYKNVESNDWAVVRCGGCGAAGTHKKCSSLQRNVWTCNICQPFLGEGGTDSYDYNDESPEDTADDIDSAASNSSDELSDEAPILEKLQHPADFIQRHREPANINISATSKVSKKEIIESEQCRPHVSAVNRGSTRRTYTHFRVRNSNAKLAPEISSTDREKIVNKLKELTQRPYQLEIRETKNEEDERKKRLLQPLFDSKSLKRKEARAEERQRKNSTLDSNSEIFKFLFPSNVDIHKLPPIPKVIKETESSHPESEPSIPVDVNHSPESVLNTTVEDSSEENNCKSDSSPTKSETFSPKRVTKRQRLSFEQKGRALELRFAAMISDITNSGSSSSKQTEDDIECIDLSDETDEPKEEMDAEILVEKIIAGRKPIYVPNPFSRGSAKSSTAKSALTASKTDHDTAKAESPEIICLDDSEIQVWKWNPITWWS